MISVFKIWVFGGICLSLFADSLLFDHMLKTSFHDGVDSPEDLIVRYHTYRQGRETKTFSLVNCLGVSRRLDQTKPSQATTASATGAAVQSAMAELMLHSEVTPPAFIEIILKSSDIN